MVLSGKYKILVVTILLAGMAFSSGCSHDYKGVIKPTVKMASLAPELVDLTDANIEKYFKANVRPNFPTVLAIARLGTAPREGYYRTRNDHQKLGIIRGDEAQGWRKLAQSNEEGDGSISQIHFVSPLLAGDIPSLISLRDAAAKLHAPLLFVYSQADSRDTGYNAGAIGYWTIVGLFLIPGHTVGYYSTCQGLLVDTRTGTILAAVDGESKREELVLPGAVKIAERRTAKQAREEALARLQEDFSKALSSLAASRPSPHHQSDTDEIELQGSDG